jgi:hypothetical protein
MGIKYQSETQSEFAFCNIYLILLHNYVTYMVLLEQSETMTKIVLIFYMKFQSFLKF